MIALISIFTVLLLAAAIAMALRHLIHSALLLTVNWLGIAAFYLWAGAEFVAFAQVLVYVGAVSMVVLFAVLLTRARREDNRAPDLATRTRVVGGFVAAMFVAAILCAAVRSTPLSGVSPAAPPLSVLQIGRELMGPQVAALLAAGVLLTVALIGAIVIASPERKEGGE